MRSGVIFLAVRCGCNEAVLGPEKDLALGTFMTLIALESCLPRRLETDSDLFPIVFMMRCFEVLQ